ncbi:MAG: DUF4350 domain-containing protein [Pseudonocardia sp.]|nr:DUF4350 domain-containing protein [Pseudonocardia sp.]
MSTAIGGPSPAALWRAARMPLVIGAFVVLAGLIIGTLTQPSTAGLLNPEGVDDGGARAVAQLLRERGVTVTVTRSSAQASAAGPGATVLVAFPELLTVGQLRAVHRSGADLVLIAPGSDALGVLAPNVEVTALNVPVRARDPRCVLPAASAAGSADLGGRLYRATGGTGCYPSDDAGAALVRLADGARTVTVIGTPAPLTNGSLADEGNAALTLRLLGAHPTLLWYLPGPEAPEAGTERDLSDLVPPGWRWAVVQLWVAAVVAALWRARRLGPVVREPLPVVVRAVEAVRGRGRLYRRAGDRGHAAETLRAAARARLAARLGLERSDGDDSTAPSALVQAVAARTGRGPAEIDALLYGAAPKDDAALVELADRLDGREGEVRRT